MTEPGTSRRAEHQDVEFLEGQPAGPGGEIDDRQQGRQQQQPGVVEAQAEQEDRDAGGHRWPGGERVMEGEDEAGSQHGGCDQAGDDCHRMPIAVVMCRPAGADFFQGINALRRVVPPAT